MSKFDEEQAELEIKMNHVLLARLLCREMDRCEDSNTICRHHIDNGGNSISVIDQKNSDRYYEAEKILMEMIK